MSATVRGAYAEVQAAMRLVRALLRENLHPTRPASQAATMAGSIGLPLVGLSASVVAGIALAISSSHYPLRVWWVLTTSGTILSIVRYVAGRRQAKLSAGAEPRGGISPSEVLKNEGKSFRAWFTSHNLLYSVVGLTLTLFVWHTYGATRGSLVVIAAINACTIAPILGALADTRNGLLGLCWHVRCPLPTFRNVRAALRDTSAVMFLRGRSEYALHCDWLATGGRRHSDALVLRELKAVDRRAAIVQFRDPAAVPPDGHERVSRAVVLALLFIVTLPVALLPVWFLAAADARLPPPWEIVVSVVPAAGRAAGGQSKPSSAGKPETSTSSSPAAAGTSADHASRGEPAGSAARSGRDTGTGGDKAGDPSQQRAQASGAQKGKETPGGESSSASSGGDRTGRGGRGNEAEPGDGANPSGNADGNGRPADGTSSASSSQAGGSQAGNGTPSRERASSSSGASGGGAGGGAGGGTATGRGDATGRGGGAGADARTAGGDGKGDQAGRGDGRRTRQSSGSGAEASGQEGPSRGYSPSGVDPQRASSPASLPALPRNPGGVIEVPLPPFTRSSAGNSDDSPKATEPPVLPAGTRSAPAYKPMPSSASSTAEPRPSDPAQRWPNWLFQLLHK